MQRKTIVLVVAGILAVGAGAWLVLDGPLAGWIRAMLDIKPSVRINFAALSGDANRSQALARFPGGKPLCRQPVPGQAQDECTMEVAKVNGVPATSLTLYFDQDRLAQVRIAFPASGHRAFMTELRAAHGMWSQLDQHGAALVAWTVPGGRLMMSEEALSAPEAVALWTSKAGLFRDAVREIGQLIQAEANLTHVVAAVQTSAGRRDRSYDTTSPFRRSFRRARAVPSEYNAELIEWLLTNAETVPSPLLLELAQRLQYTDSKEAMRWFATFHLLLDFDGARCADPTAASGSGADAVLALYPVLTRQARENPGALREARAAARNWARVRQIRSSPMWLCATAMRAVRVNSQGQPAPVSVRELMLPESKWPAAWRDVLVRSEPR